MIIFSLWPPHHPQLEGGFCGSSPFKDVSWRAAAAVVWLPLSHHSPMIQHFFRPQTPADFCFWCSTPCFGSSSLFCWMLYPKACPRRFPEHSFAERLSTGSWVCVLPSVHPNHFRPTGDGENLAPPCIHYSAIILLFVIMNIISWGPEVHESLHLHITLSSFEDFVAFSRMILCILLLTRFDSGSFGEWVSVVCSQN